MYFKTNFVLVLTLFTNICDIQSANIANSNWWKNAVFYQIYPRSFKDSDNDGIGDIRGIISKLDYLKETGVTAAWLSPIYASPQVDQGYDISNFYEIDKDYGTMQDFDDLVKTAHNKGIKIIMDFVPNHSSNQHEWFKSSENQDGIYDDFYIWRNGSSDSSPPNNWISVFKNSAWTYSPKRKQYYLHQFSDAQPDLNYRSPNLVKEMKNVLKFWLDKGVDGFRMDAVPFLFESASFQNEPRSNKPHANPLTTEYLRHVYTQDQPETFDMICQWRKLLDDYSTNATGDPRIMMTEAYTDIHNTMYYYGNEERDGAHFTFNFFLITDIKKNSAARDIVFAIQKWLAALPTKYTTNWVLGNHDNHRVATRFGPANVDNCNMLIALLPGIMVTYNGEEIGQENGDVSYTDGKDPNACSAGEEEFSNYTRDYERTPFHWDNTTNAGFNTGGKPWLPVSNKYTENNLEAQKATNVPNHYQIYQQLIKLRENNVLQSGNLVIRVVSEEVVVFSRSLHGNKTYLAILNFASKDMEISINRELFSATEHLKVVLASITSDRKVGELIVTKNLSLKANEGLVAVSTTEVPNTTLHLTTF